MSEWKECKLGDIAIITDCEHKTAPLVDYSEFISVRTSNIQNGKIDFENSNRVSSEVYEEWTKRLKPNDGDIVLAREAPVGEVGWIPKGKKICLGQRTVLIRTTDKSINPKYLLYYLVNDEVKNELINRSTGSVVEHLNVKDIKNFDLKIHNLLEEQVNIASVLTSLDDKIDLLHRQNATLEAMAETLFRQWFVVEAKADWEVKPLSSIADFLNGLACQKFSPKNDIEKLPVLKIKDLSSGITENSDWASTDVKPEYVVRNGDVIFAWSASLMVKIWNGDDCILNQHLFKVTSPVYPKWFYYLWCKYHLEEFIAKAASHATTMGHIKRGDLDEAMVLVPSKNELKEMTLTIEPIIDKLVINNNQIRTITALRDTLLPKLMSGEVRVKM